MIARLRSWWEQIQKYQKAIGVVAIVLIVIVVLALIITVVRFNGTGFNGYTKVSTTTETTASPPKITRTEEYQPGKNLWDWLQLLIIPLVLAAIALLFNLANSRTERQIAKDRYKQDQQIAKQRYEQDQQIALDKQHEDLLQAYLDRISELLLKGSLRTSSSDEVRNVARVRTITVLTQLNARRIGFVFTFLREAGLMSTTPDSSVVSLKNADLRVVKWGQASLSEANLSGADLVLAKLSGADLSGADLSKATVTEEQLKKAKSLESATMPDGSKHP